MIDTLRDVLGVWVVFSLFAFFAVLSIAGTYYGVWEINDRPPEDRPLIRGVHNAVGDVLSAVESVVEETGERIGR